MICRSLAVLATLCAGLAACGEDPPQHHSTLLEVIKLAGTGKEDHANHSDVYGGSVVRWRDDTTGEVSTYGFVNASNTAKRIMNAAEHPTEYQPPELISFDE